MTAEIELLFKDEVYAIIGAAIEVQRTLGSGVLEAVYQEAFELELGERNIPFEPKKRIRILYKGRKLKKEYEADLLAYDSVLIEIKATSELTSRDEAQLLNYLNATGHRVGLLINFGSTGKLEWKRFVN